LRFGVRDGSNCCAPLVGLWRTGAGCLGCCDILSSLNCAFFARLRTALLTAQQRGIIFQANIFLRIRLARHRYRILNAAAASLSS
jgi:hypothetical protein